MRDAYKASSVDSWFRALREINATMLEKGKHFPLTRESTSTEDEDENLMNMLSCCKFHPKASTATSAIGASSSTEDEKHTKWRFQTEVIKLFRQALEEAFPGYEEKLSWLPRGENNFRCDNVIDIWRTKKQDKSGSFSYIERPKDVGEKIKDTLVKQKSSKKPRSGLVPSHKKESHMIEGDPRVDAVGFVFIKLSGNWMAENIHKMLRDGIDTWAPERESKSMILYTPTWDESNLRPVDVLRRQFLIMSQKNMLEYVKYNVATSSGNGMSLPNGDEVLKQIFRIVDKDGLTTIFSKTDDDAEPNLCGKSRGMIHLEEESCGYPLEDLQALLWYGLECEEIDWVVCVAPTQQKDYIDDYLVAADYAMWMDDRIMEDRISCPVPTSSVGFKTCSTSLEDLLNVLYKAQYPCEAGEAAKLLGYTDEAVLDCALTYTFLKNHRLADCEYQDILDIKGNTFVYLLRTKAEIHKVTKDARKTINEIKAELELSLEDDKQVWTQGVERELGLHLLMFTKCIDDSFLSFMPHILCEYLYELCEKFNNFHDQCYKTHPSTALEFKTRLLLCEASAIVMEKGFHLLGVTQKPLLQAVSAALALNYIAPIRMGSPIQNKRIRTRFEVFSVFVHVNGVHVDSELDEVLGSIKISDEHGLRPYGWTVPASHAPGLVTLSSHNCEKVENNEWLKIGNPKSGRSVPIASSMLVVMALHGISKYKDDILAICVSDAPARLNFSEFLEGNAQVERRNYCCQGVDGNARIYYILLKDAVDAVIKAELDGSCQHRVHGEIYAMYDNKDREDCYEDAFYTASLLEFTGAFGDFKGHLGLTRSNLAVPSDGKLRIGVKITDVASRMCILQGQCTFPASRNGIFEQEISDNLCSLKLTLDWSDED